VWVDGRNYHVQPAKVDAKKNDQVDIDKEAKDKAENEGAQTDAKPATLPLSERIPLEVPNQKLRAILLEILAIAQKK
jgi:hypothetical protein